MKYIYQNAQNLADAVMDLEVEDFEDCLKQGDFSYLTSLETRLLSDWLNDEAPTCEEVKNAFKKINHVYALAFLTRYDVEPTSYK